MSLQIIPRVILAGGEAKRDIQAASGQKNRSMIEVMGKTMLRHVVDALVVADASSPIVVMGNLPVSSQYTVVEDQGGFVENLFGGLNYFAGSEFVLISTADLPYLTGSSVTEFVTEALRCAAETESALLFPVVPVSDCYARFPGVKRTSLRLKEGEFTGGNLMLVRPSLILAQKKRISEAYAARKSPLKLAVILGLGTLIRLILSQKVSPNYLDIPTLESKVSAVMGGRANAVICSHPELATDLDRLSDFEAAGLQLKGSSFEN